MLFVGDDWAEAHHDIEIEDDSGRVRARKRLPEGLAGITALHELIAEYLDPTGDLNQVLVGIETERGPWVQALLAAGYTVYPINPMQVARYRERHSTSGAKSDAADAHLLAEIVRLDRVHHRPVAGALAKHPARSLAPANLSRAGADSTFSSPATRWTASSPPARASLTHLRKTSPSPVECPCTRGPRRCDRLGN